MNFSVKESIESDHLPLTVTLRRERYSGENTAE